MRKAKDISLTCSICGITYEKTQQLTTHIQRGHNITVKEYYDTYIKTDTEGRCLTCGKETTWTNKLRSGYSVYCSSACSSASKKVITIRKIKDKTEACQSSLKKVEPVGVKQIASEKPIVKQVTKPAVKPVVKQAQSNTASKVNMEDVTKMINKYDGVFLLNGCGLNEYANGIFTATCYDCNRQFKINEQELIKRISKNEKLCTLCNCSTIDVTSKIHEVAEFVRSFGLEVIEHAEGVINQTLDIFVPSAKLAIEFDDLTMHNELHVDRNYHVKKTNACEDKGIQLIHLYEDEWEIKNTISKSRIKGLLGLNTHIYARKCEVREVDYQIASAFLKSNHIQGSCVSKYNYALYFNDKPVALMTFGKSRFKDEFELLRYCSAIDINVIGGASKLFATFMKEHPEINEIVSFADRRWSIGNLYEKLGFEKVDVTQCCYQYIVGNHRENRIKYQKHKLITKYGADPNLTEHQIMLDMNIFRIYDCGNLKFVYKKNK